MRTSVLTLLLLAASYTDIDAQVPTGALDIYYIDTEGGQATLFVGPTGESLLVDTGNGGDRDLGRIVELLDDAGIRQIDHLWTTHYHGDHIGALLALADRMPILHFYDHGEPDAADRIVSAEFLSSYAALTRGKRTVVAPGDKVAMAGVDITTVASDGRSIQANLPGGGNQNAACAGVEQLDERDYIDTDNGASAGFVLTYGRFRTIDLGDLTWNGELELMCPLNRIGTVDLYLTSHHGLERSGSPALVHALRPRVAVMNNGTRKGGALGAFRVLYESPGLEDLWQLHWSHNAKLDNSPAMFVANVDDDATIANVLTTEPATAPRRPGGPGGPGFARGGTADHAPAYSIHVAAKPDGTFTVTNTRNGFSKTYERRL
jgi:beta-lactamase superfamily II metal-dependent hydrolase